MAALNVGLITTSLHVGGAEASLLNLVDVLSRPEVFEREQVRLHLCAVGRNSVFGPDTRIAQARELSDRAPVHLIKARRFYDPASWLALRRYLQAQNVEVLHTFMAQGDILGNLLGRQMGLPVLTSLRNSPETYLRMRTDLRWLMSHVAVRWASRLVALSEDIRHQVIETWQVEPERIITIPNAANIEKFLALPLNKPSMSSGAGSVITTVGRLSAQKAHDDFLKAAALVLEKEPAVRFRIIGQGPLENQLRTLSGKLGIASKVEFAGLSDDIPGVYRDSDIFVLSSHWEGMSMAAIEAMAAGLPQVLTHVGANPELIADGRHGLLVPSKAPEKLAEAILALVRDPALRLQMGLSARERAGTHFSADSNSRQYCDLYRQLAGLTTSS